MCSITERIYGTVNQFGVNSKHIIQYIITDIQLRVGHSKDIQRRTKHRHQYDMLIDIVTARYSTPANSNVLSIANRWAMFVYNIRVLFGDIT